MAVAGTNLTFDRVSSRLHQLFDGLITVSDDEAKDPVKRESMFLSRAYMALSLLHFTEANTGEAAKSVTDGSKDGGIDCIYISKKHNKIYLGQSKFSKNEDNAIRLAGFNRFRDGAKDVLNQRWTCTNSYLHRFKNDIQLALDDINTTVELLYAHTGQGELSNHIEDSLNSLLGEFNEDEELITFSQFRLALAADVARRKARPENINAEIQLKGFGQRKEPYRAVYGSMPAEDAVRLYEEFGHKLFAENLRFAIEKSDVNDSIRNTAKEQPEDFWYFNNGVTIICDDVKKTLAGGSSNEAGSFEIKRLSVINGAQTISSLHRASKEGTDLSTADILVRVIAIAETPEDFTTQVTTANNTQNDLSPVDFVAADDNQDRIKREAELFGKVYSYRRGEGDTTNEFGFTVREATIAAACASGELKLAVSAKRYISGLWENTKREPYTKLFNESVSAIQLWNLVRIMRVVDDELQRIALTFEGRDKLIAIHANRFILFTIFQDIEIDLSDSVSDLKPLEKFARDLTNENLTALLPFVNTLYPDGYAGNVFKNTDKQVTLLTALKGDLPAHIG